MKWCIGDVHGSYFTLVALIEKINRKDKNAELIFLGDYCDRGPRSKQVIKYIIKNIKENKIKAVRGNHEDLMVEDLMHPSPFSNWNSNGGDNTISSYREPFLKEDEDFTDEEISLITNEMKEDAKFLSELPLYLILDDEDDEGRKLLVSHAPSTDFVEEYLEIYGENSKENSVELYEKEHGLLERCKITKKIDLFNWNRNLPIHKSKKYFGISGHNIAKHLKDRYENIEGYNEKTEVIIDKNKGYASIDTGAYIGKEYGVTFGGNLTAISFPNLEIIQQKNID